MYSLRALTRVSIKLLLTVLVVITTAYTGYELYAVLQLYSSCASKLITTLEEEARTFSASLDQKLKAVITLSQPLAQKLTAKEDSQEIIKSLEATLTSSLFIYGIGVLYNPAHTKNKELYAPYVYKEGEKSKLIALNSFYDYAKRAWYQEALQSDVPIWSDLLCDVVHGKRIIRLSVPFFNFDTHIKAHIPLGVLIIDVLADNFNQEACRAAFRSSLDSYGLIVGKSGILIAHPHDQYLEQKKTVGDLALITGSTHWRLVAQEIANRQSGSAQFESVVAHEPVPNTGWSVVMVYPYSSNHACKQELYNNVLLAVISLLAACLCIVLLFTFSFGAPWLTWISVVLFSLMCSLSIFALLLFNFNNAFKTTITHLHGEAILRDNDALERFMLLHKQAHPVGQSQSQELPLIEENARSVPIGISITSLVFAKAGDITVGGIVWQKTPKQIFDMLADSQKDKPLFTIANTDTLVFEQAYTHQAGNFSVQGWRFKATIKPAFDNTKYPLDAHTIKLRFQETNPALGILFVPDFSAFSTFCKHKRAYLADTITIPEWTIEDIYFSSMFTSVSHNFGLENKKQHTVPDLFFNIQVRRNFVYPLVSGLLPLAMVCSLLFVVLIITGPEITPFTLLGSLSSLLFSLLVAHQRIQAMIPSTSKFIYLEYFYFIMYGFVFVVSVIVFLHSTHFIRKIRFAQLLYWPTLFLAFLILTLIVFWNS